METGHWVHVRLTHTSAIEFVTRATSLGIRVLMEQRNRETEVYLRLG